MLSTLNESMIYGLDLSNIPDCIFVFNYSSSSLESLELHSGLSSLSTSNLLWFKPLVNNVQGKRVSLKVKEREIACKNNILSIVTLCEQRPIHYQRSVNHDNLVQIQLQPSPSRVIFNEKLLLVALVNSHRTRMVSRLKITLWNMIVTY